MFVKGVFMMQPTVVMKESLTIMGIAARTSNQAEATGNGGIPKLWQQFYQEQISNQITKKNSPACYGLYTEYEDGARGLYTMMIGHAVTPAAQDQAGLVKKEVPAAKYLVFTSKQGPLSEVVPQAWQQIWSYFEEATDERIFTGDFEYYDQRSADPMNAVVDIYIAVK